MTPFTIALPEDIRFILQKLEAHHWEGYLVGGCVRDALLGKTPHDWDVTTNALPEEICRVFDGYPLITVGREHGTIGVILHENVVEITTYRTDGVYEDHRHPEQVVFTASLQEDLSRRDFTVNAMAYHPVLGLVDCFHGLDDLNDGILRAVGDPMVRFDEDSLRILRGLRFAGQLGFSLEPTTQAAMVQQRHLLRCVSGERIAAELEKLLCSPFCTDLLRQNKQVFFALFPQLEKMVDFNQNTPYHCYDVWEHTLHAMAATPPDFVLQLTMLFHDSGKPETYVEDDDGVGHFPHHGRRSLAITQEALTPLHLPKKTLERVCLLVQHHDLVFQPEERWIKRQLNRFGQEVFFQLLAVHRSDTLAQSDLCRPRLAMLDQCESICQKVLEEQSCFRLQDLAVNGNDLLSLSIPKGQQIGKTLQYLLQMVIDGQCENSREPLLSLAKKWTQISYLHPPILHE